MADDTRYVDFDSGNDTTGDGTSTLPWKTLSHAIDNHSATTAGDTITINVKGTSRSVDSLVFDNGSSKHDGFNFVIQPWSGEATSFNLRPTGAGNGLINITGCTTGSISMSQFDYDATISSEGGPAIDFAANMGMTVSITSATVTADDSGLGTGIVNFNAGGISSPYRDVTFTSCTLAARYCIVSGEDGGIVTLTDTNISRNGSGTTGYLLYLSGNGTFDGLIFDNVTGDSSNYFSYANNSSSVPSPKIYKFIVRDSNITFGEGFTFENNVELIEVDDSTLTSITGIVLGFGNEDHKSGSYPLPWNTANMGKCRLWGNSLNIGGSSGGVSIHVDNAEVAYNHIISTGTHVLGLDAKGIHAHHNIVEGDLGCMTLYGVGCKVHDNTVYSSATGSHSAVFFGMSSSTDNSYDLNQYGKNNDWYNNIVFVHGGGMCFTDYEGNKGTTNEARGARHAADSVTYPEDDLMADYIDYNCYWTTGGVIAKLTASATNCSTIAELQSAWSGWNELYGSVNDQHSVIADPQFADADNGDFTVNNYSLYFAGKPDADGTETSLGASLPTVEQSNIANMLDVTVGSVPLWKLIKVAASKRWN